MTKQPAGETPSAAAEKDIVSRRGALRFLLKGGAGLALTGAGFSAGLLKGADIKVNVAVDIDNKEAEYLYRERLRRARFGSMEVLETPPEEGNPTFIVMTQEDGTLLITSHKKAYETGWLKTIITEGRQLLEDYKNAAPNAISQQGYFEEALAEIDFIPGTRGSASVITINNESWIVSNDHVINALPWQVEQLATINPASDVAVLPYDSGYTRYVDSDDEEHGIFSYTFDESLLDEYLDGRQVQIIGVGTTGLNKVIGEAILRPKDYQAHTYKTTGLFEIYVPREQTEGGISIGGMSGSPVMDISTGKIVGVLHSAGDDTFHGKDAVKFLFSGPQALGTMLARATIRKRAMLASQTLEEEQRAAQEAEELAKQKKGKKK